MADSRNRTLVDFSSGTFDVLRRDLQRFKRRGRRLKELATLGLAAEAHGLSVLEAQGKLVLSGVALLAPTTAKPVEAPYPAPPLAPPIAQESRPEIAGILAQFMDTELVS